jgi:NAD(P)H-dependent FMN reductase
MTAIAQKTVYALTGINVLIIIGLRAGSVNRVVKELAADSAADGITLNMFDSLSDLPRYSETLESGERRVLSQHCTRPQRRPTQCWS